MSGIAIPLLVRTVFTTTVNLGLVLLVAGTWRAGRALGEAPRTTLRWTIAAAAGGAAWLAFTAALALRGTLLDVQSVPPPFAVLLALSSAGTIALALSPFGGRLARGLTPVGLVGFQGLRVAIEWVLHALHGLRIVPVQMTWSGWNFDVLSGASALVVAVLWSRGRAGRVAIAVWNVAGLALLANVVTIALLSAPFPIRRFWNEPANTFVLQAPWVWLPAFLVQGALFGHLLVFRWLALSRESSATRQRTTRERIQRTARRS